MASTTADVDTTCCSVSNDVPALVARYSPVLMLAKDDFDPTEVQSFLNQPGRDGRKPDVCLTDVNPRPSSLQPGECPIEATLLGSGAARPRLTVIGGNLRDPSTYDTIYKSKVVSKYDPVTYAEVRSSGNSVTIDYWFFYIANFSIGNVDNHEGDWERAQVRITATSVAEALKVDPAREPAKVILAYSRHRCDSTQSMPVRTWDIAQHDRSHPLVYVGAGSHANYFDAGNEGKQALTLVDGACFLGSAGDFTPGDRRVSPLPVLIDCAALLPKWTSFQGGWGVEGPRGPCQHR